MAFAIVHALWQRKVIKLRAAVPVCFFVMVRSIMALVGRPQSPLSSRGGARAAAPTGTDWRTGATRAIGTPPLRWRVDRLRGIGHTMVSKNMENESCGVPH